MDGIATAQLAPPLPVWVPRRAIDLASYERMASAGVLDGQGRLELIEGALVAIPPQGIPHMATIMALMRLLIPLAADRAEVSVRATFRLGEINAPEPDVALLRPRADRYRTAPAPKPADVLLLIEVADSSLRFDREVKAPLYARHSIAEYWIVDLEGAAVLVHRDPQPEGYASLRTARAGERLDLPGLPDAQIAVADILG